MTVVADAPQDHLHELHEMVSVLSPGEPVTLFTWGYYGWGSATPELIAAADLVERERGHEPPIFVDLRRSRDVRANGFRGDSFGKTIGGDRYRWMPALGNPAMGSRDTVEAALAASEVAHAALGIPRLRVAQPAAAEELLDMVLVAAREGRRIIAYCSCPFPVADGEAACHRVDVAALVLAVARRRDVDLTVVEWPGGEPDVVDLGDVDPAIARAVLSGARSSIPLGRGLPSVQLCGLPLDSACRMGDAFVLARPARAGAGGWSLPINAVLGHTTEAAAEKLSRSVRRANGYDPVRAKPKEASKASKGKSPRAAAQVHRDPSDAGGVALRSRTALAARLHQVCVVVSADSGVLDECMRTGGAGMMQGKPAPASVGRALDEARDVGLDTAIIFVDQQDHSRLLAWATVTNLSGSRLWFVGARPLPAGLTIQDLRPVGSTRPSTGGVRSNFEQRATPAFLSDWPLGGAEPIPLTGTSPPGAPAPPPRPPPAPRAPPRA